MSIPTPIQVLALSAGVVAPLVTPTLTEQIAALREVVATVVAEQLERLPAKDAHATAAAWRRVYCVPWPTRPPSAHADPVSRVMSLTMGEAEWPTRAALERVHHLVSLWDAQWDKLYGVDLAELAADLAWSLAATARGDQRWSAYYLAEVVRIADRGPSLCACE